MKLCVIFKRPLINKISSIWWRHDRIQSYKNSLAKDGSFSKNAENYIFWVSDNKIRCKRERGGKNDEVLARNGINSFVSTTYVPPYSYSFFFVMLISFHHIIYFHIHQWSYSIFILFIISFSYIHNVFGFMLTFVTFWPYTVISVEIWRAHMIKSDVEL